MDGSRSVFAFLASPREYLDFMALNDSLQSHWFGFDENSGSFVALKWVGTEGRECTGHSYVNLMPMESFE